jgi:type IV pilus assembly protein PilW
MRLKQTISLRRRQAGMNLIELMIAVAIGLFLLAGLVTVFASSNRAYVDLNRAAQQIENGRFAVQTLTDDVSLAGYYGRYSAQLAVPGSLPNPCETVDVTVIRNAAALWIQGYNAPTGAPSPTCITDANHVDGTDILVVRRADSQTTAPASLVAEQIYIQGSAEQSATGNPIVKLGTAGNFTLTEKTGATPIRKYHVHVYFIAPCSIPNGGGSVCTGSSDDGGAPIPTLKRLELTLNAAGTALEMKVVPLVEGIADFQVDYGIDTDGDGVPNGNYVTAPALADWQNVVSVRVNVLARNLEATSGFTDTKVYDMGVAGTVTPGNAYKHHVYNAVIRLVNPSARRES